MVDTPEAPKAFTFLWGRITTVSTLVLAGITASVLSILLNGALSRITALEESAREANVHFHELGIHAKSHERESDYWKNSIEKNRQRIQDLATNPTARPNAFTSDDGKELERRIDGVERCCDSMKIEIANCKKVADKSHSHYSNRQTQGMDPMAGGKK